MAIDELMISSQEQDIRYGNVVSTTTVTTTTMTMITYVYAGDIKRCMTVRNGTGSL
jgi:hypothetical protein